MKTGKSSPNNIFLSLLPVAAVITVVLAGLVKHSQGTDILKICILTFLLTAAAVVFLRLQQEDILCKEYSRLIFTGSYLISILLILLPENPQVFIFWMLGGLLTAMLIDGKLGLLVFFNLTFILSITVALRPEATIQLLVMGVFMTLLSGALKQISTAIYAGIILLSTNITLAFVMNNFAFGTEVSYNYLSSFFSIFAVLVTAFLLSVLYSRVQNYTEQTPTAPLSAKEKEKSPTDDNPAITIDAPGVTQSLDASDLLYDRTVRTSYDLLLEKNNGLLLKLKEFSESLYEHSMVIGDLSGRAAGLVGADEALAKAGGYFHEIGKINGKNYIDEGLKLAEEYAFPKELKDILKQHNIKHEKPTFVEAAIVMLSDNVVSTIDYIKKTGDNKYTADKIIDNIFQMRMDKGTFDESGLSVRDFKLLKDFYQQEFGRKAAGQEG